MRLVAVARLYEPSLRPRAKKHWGGLKAGWVEPDLRERVVDFVHHWRERGFEDGVLVRGLGIGTSKFYS